MADISPFIGFATPPTASAISRAFCARLTTSSATSERGELEARHPENVVRLELPRGADDARYATAARLLARVDGGGDPAPRRARGVLPLRAAVRLRRASATRGAGSSPPCASSRSSVASCCRTRRRCPRPRRIAGGCCARRARRSRRCSGCTATRAARRAPSSTRRPSAAPAVDATTTDGVRHRAVADDDRRRRSTACALLLRRQADPDRRRAPPLRDDARAARPRCGRWTSPRAPRRRTTR